MTEIAERYRRVAARFTETVAGVAPDAWDNPSPCEGWVARDVVRHLAEWFPPFLRDGAGIELPAGPSADVDPAGAWKVLDDAVQAVLDDPATEGRSFSHAMAGQHRLADAIATFFLGDVLVHTWDLARATGQEVVLDPDEVHTMLTEAEPLDEVLRASGHYGPRVAVPADADEQTRLIAFLGRQP